MKKNIPFFLLVLCLSGIYSQKNYNRLPLYKEGCPIFIVNEDIIANEHTIAEEKESVKEIRVLKDKPNRGEHGFFNFTSDGILFIDIDVEIAYKTQSELNGFFGLEAKNSIYLNGYLMEHPKYKIATTSIVETELISPSPENGISSRVLNIWTLDKDKRINGCSKQQAK